MNYYLKRIYLIAILTFISVGIYAQSGTEKITVSFKDISLKEAMPMIEEVSAYTFFYDATETDLEQHVSLTANNEEIRLALRRMFGPTNLFRFKFSKKQILLISPNRSLP